MKVTLKRTKTKPLPVLGMNAKGEIVAGDEYLFTNNGRTTGWWLALKMTFTNENPPDEIQIEVRGLKNESN